MIDKNQVLGTLDRFSTVGLKEMDGVRLMNRQDVKFLMHLSALSDTLERGEKLGYKLLQIENCRSPGYSTEYFDTEDSRMYSEHHNRRVNRQKIRIREYLETGERFLEIKTKNNKAKTRKCRTLLAPGHSLDNESRFISQISPFNSEDLRSQLTVKFYRITLVHLLRRERITIDREIVFTSRDKTFAVKNLVIVEVKMEMNPLRSPFCKLLKSRGVRPSGFSKYAIGQVLLNNTNIKYNRYKEKLLRMNRICGYKEIFNGYAD